MAAIQIDEVKDVVTVGTPSAPQYLKNLLHNSIEEIKEKGIAEVNIGGRPFTVKKEFIYRMNKTLVMHVMSSLIERSDM